MHDLMPKIEKSTQELDLDKERAETSLFLKRVQAVKRDPAFAGFAGRISGLYEKPNWIFICSEHVSGRFANEEKLKKHFEEKSHS